MSSFEQQFMTLLDWYDQRGFNQLYIANTVDENPLCETTQYKVVFVVDTVSHSSQECLDMLTKIIAAMKLSREDIVIVPSADWNDDICSTKAIVILGETPVLTKCRLVTNTPSLMQMLHNPNLKLQAWKQLQGLMGQLASL